MGELYLIEVVWIYDEAEGWTLVAREPEPREGKGGTVDHWMKDEDEGEEEEAP